MIKIVFICGSLKQGKDGVGDYTRRLAGELIRQGHHSSILAINDRYSETIKKEKQYDSDIPIQSYRLPELLSLKEKKQLSKVFIDEVNPDWLSLQYVPFSFNFKGLPFGWNHLFKTIGNGRKWHIMFHELWVGIDKESGMKHYIWGTVQKKLIKSLIRSITPNVIHTQTQIYKYLISRMDVIVYQLPLFSNIPVDIETKKIIKKNTIRFVLFGNIQPYSYVNYLVEELASFSNKKGVFFNLILLGRNGNLKGKWIKLWKQAGHTIEDYGEQTKGEVSKILHSVDIGLSTTPYLQIEKSGTTAAMKEHELPIICIGRSWTPRKVNIDFHIKGVFEYCGQDVERVLAFKEIGASNSLGSITKQFINTLIK